MCLLKLQHCGYCEKNQEVHRQHCDEYREQLSKRIQAQTIDSGPLERPAPCRSTWHFPAPMMSMFNCKTPGCPSKRVAAIQRRLNLANAYVKQQQEELAEMREQYLINEWCRTTFRGRQPIPRLNDYSLLTEGLLDVTDDGFWEDDDDDEEEGEGGTTHMLAAPDPDQQKHLKQAKKNAMRAVEVTRMECFEHMIRTETDEFGRPYETYMPPPNKSYREHAIECLSPWIGPPFKWENVKWGPSTTPLKPIILKPMVRAHIRPRHVHCIRSPAQSRAESSLMNSLVMGEVKNKATKWKAIKQFFRLNNGGK